MATLDSLKWALRQATAASSPKQPLSDTQYSAGFDILVRGSGWMTYQDFIIPQLSQLLSPLFDSRINISALEIGPGPKSLLGYLPSRLRRKVRRYTAFEPNGLFATSLEEWLCSTTETESPLPCLESPPDIHRIPFILEDNIGSGTVFGTSDDDGKYDVILFCHSMYGMKPKHRFIERALEMLVERPQGGMVAVFHTEIGSNREVREKDCNISSVIKYPISCIRTSISAAYHEFVQIEEADVIGTLRAVYSLVPSAVSVHPATFESTWRNSSVYNKQDTIQITEITRSTS